MKKKIKLNFIFYRNFNDSKYLSSVYNKTTVLSLIIIPF